jgi:hypothetical protein
VNVLFGVGPRLDTTTMIAGKMPAAMRIHSIVRNLLSMDPPSRSAWTMLLVTKEKPRFLCPQHKQKAPRKAGLKGRKRS